MKGVKNSTDGGSRDGGSDYGRQSMISPLGPVAAIMLAGKTGSGKSSFIRLLGGLDAEGHEPISDDGLESCTKKTSVYMAKISGRKVLLLDTPGFDDSAVDNLTILNDIVSNLSIWALQPQELHTHGVIFLHDISEKRFGGSQQKTLQLLKNLCGPKAMKNVIIGTTMWDVSPKKLSSQIKRENDFLRDHWQGIRATVRVPEDDEEVALDIVNDLLACSPTMLLVQEEMLRPPHTCEATTVGRIAIPEGRLEVEKLKRELDEQQKMARGLEEEQQQKFREQQVRDQELFDSERAKLRESAERMEEDLRKMKKAEEEKQNQNLERIAKLLEESQKTMREAEGQRTELESKRYEELKLEKEAATAKHNEMMEHLRKQEAEFHERMVKQEEELKERMEEQERVFQEKLDKERSEREKEMDMLMKKLAWARGVLDKQLEKARKRANNFWERIKSLFWGDEEDKLCEGYPKEE